MIPFAIANLINNFNACSGLFISAKLPQVFITPITKNNTNKANAIACIAPLIFTITFQTPPSLNASGGIKSNPTISENLEFHVLTVFIKLLDIQLKSKYLLSYFFLEYAI